MARTAVLSVKILTDAKGAGKGLDQASTKVGAFEKSMKKAAVPAAIVGAAVVAFGKQAFDAASRTQQAMGGVDAVFGKNAATVKRWAAGAGESVGLAKSEYGELATVIGSQLKNLGLPMDKVAGQTKTLIAMGADLSATYGGTTKEAVEALSSALKGETDPIEKYGMSIKQASIAAQQAAEKSQGLTFATEKEAKAHALLTLMTNQSKDAHGRFASEANTAAGQQQRMSAAIENMKSSLGQGLLPIVSAFAAQLADVAKWVQKNSTFFAVLVTVIGGFAAAILVINAAFKAYQAVMIVVTAVQWAYNTALGATLLPILAVVAAVAILAIGFVLLWKKSDKFRAAVMATWAAVRAGAVVVGNAVKAVWNATWGAITAAARAYGNAARAVFNAVRTAVGYVVSKVQSLVSAIRAIKVPTSIRAAFDAVKNAAGHAWDKVKQLASVVRGIKVPGAVRAAMDAIKSAANTAKDAVQALVGWLSRLKVPKLHFPKIPKALRSAPAPAGLAAAPAGGPSLLRGPTVAAAGYATPRASYGGGGVVININGAIDPEGTARAVRRVLVRHGQRVGTAP